MRRELAQTEAEVVVGLGLRFDAFGSGIICARDERDDGEANGR
jgi:hypothetical protein